MADKFTVYHNPKCSKSRAALQYLNERGHSPNVIEYLIVPLTREGLRDLIGKLGMRPDELIRKNEEVYKEHFKGKQLNDEESIDAMLRFPKLIERPIIVRGKRAVIGRPVENIDRL